ncbi:MAG: hypothetical protein ACUVS3_04620 [Thermodesulfobacteriota bacterium]
MPWDCGFGVLLWGVARGLSRGRRIVVVRQSAKQLGDKAQGRLLGDLPSYGYQLMVTNKRIPCGAFWRFYNGGAYSDNAMEDLVEGAGMDASQLGSSWPMRPTFGWCSLPRRSFALTERRWSSL